MKLLKILAKYDPTLLSSGQIRTMCPFRENHKDGSGQSSMFLTPDRNTYHCFSCRAKGKLVTLLTTEFEIGYFEAMDMVCLTDYEKKKVSSLSESTSEYYWDLKPPDEFLKKGYTEEVLRHFHVGTTIVGKMKNVSVIPMFKGFDLKGIQFRFGSGDDRKVWFSEGFNREEFLYNGTEKYTEEVTIVEGPSDTWRLKMFDEPVWGILGTEMSDWQAEQISKVKRVNIASDTDWPGIQAADKWYKKLHKHTEVMFVNYPDKDPGAIRSIRVWRKAKRELVNYAEFKYLTGID